MDEATLIQRLGALQPPGAELAKARAMEAISSRLLAKPGAAPRPSGRFRPRLPAAAVAAVAFVVAFSLLTPPGHAFTAWIGDRLGLGQPGGHPTLQSLRHFAMHGTGGESQPAYVLLRGPGPNGGHYEFVTFRMKRAAGADFPENGARCFQLELPEARNLFNAGCGLPAEHGGLLFAGVAGNSAPGGSFQLASGRVSANVAQVRIAVDGHRVPVELRPIPSDLIAHLHIRRPFKFFIAPLPDDLHSGSVIVTARDAAGRVVARRTSRLFEGGKIPGQPGILR